MLSVASPVLEFEGREEDVGAIGGFMRFFGAAAVSFTGMAFPGDFPKTKDLLWLFSLSLHEFLAGDVLETAPTADRKASNSSAGDFAEDVGGVIEDRRLLVCFLIFTEDVAGSSSSPCFLPPRSFDRILVSADSVAGVGKTESESEPQSEKGRVDDDALFVDARC